MLWIILLLVLLGAVSILFGKRVAAWIVLGLFGLAALGVIIVIGIALSYS